MSKHETTNTWSDGLIMDFHPMNTPNTVLTDMLNGTLITYNGNEMSLQNDQGNYKLKYCKLAPNYLPVGLKEYGGILYIVSQNPLTDYVEIGSYPSPLMITDPTLSALPEALTVPSIIESEIINKGKKYGNFSDLEEKAKKIVFLEENYKLNPGDEYCLKIENNPNYKFETIEYSILDEEGHSHNITDKIKLESGNKDSFNNVAWTIPGYLSIQPKIPELGVGGTNIQYFYAPKQEGLKSTTVNYSINYRLNVNDPYFIKSGILDEWCSNLKSNTEIKFRVVVKSGNTVIYDNTFSESYISSSSNGIVSFGEFGYTDWYDNNRIIWKNFSGSFTTSDQIIKIGITPILFNSGANIVYDNLTQELTFDLNNVDNIPFSFGTSLYKHYVHKNENNEYVQFVQFDVAGPMVTSYPVEVIGEIKDENDNVILTLNDFYTGIGDNLIKIPFNENFKKESKYKLVLTFESNNNVVIEKSLYTSEVFNSFMDRTRFDEIAVEEWSEKFWDYYKITFNKDNLEAKDNGIWDGWKSELSAEDKKHLSWEQYSNFHKEIDSGLSSELIYQQGRTYNIKGNLIWERQMLQGPLWNITEQINGNTINSSYGSGSIKVNENSFVGYENTYVYQKGDPFEFFEVKTEKLSPILGYDRRDIYLDLSIWANTDKDNQTRIEAQLKHVSRGNVGDLLYAKTDTNNDGHNVGCTFSNWSYTKGGTFYINLKDSDYGTNPILCYQHFDNWESHLLNGSAKMADFTWTGENEAGKKRSWWSLLFPGFEQNGKNYMSVIIPISTSEEKARAFYNNFISKCTIFTEKKNKNDYCLYELVEYSSVLKDELLLNNTVNLNLKVENLNLKNSFVNPMILGKKSVEKNNNFKIQIEKEQYERKQDYDSWMKMYDVVKDKNAPYVYFGIRENDLSIKINSNYTQYKQLTPRMTLFKEGTGYWRATQDSGMWGEDIIYYYSVGVNPYNIRLEDDTEWKELIYM